MPSQPAPTTTPPGSRDLPGPMAMYEVGAGAPLVVLPGLSRHSGPPTDAGLARAVRLFSGLARKTGRRVCVLERPRGVDGAIRMEAMAELHAGALRRRFAGPVDILGASTGGAIALQTAVDHPGVVGRLVVACAAAWLGDEGRLKLAAYARRIASGRSGAGVLASVLAGPLTRPALAALLWLAWLRERSLDPSDMLATIHAECGFDVREALGRVRAPTLVVGGGRDRAFPPEMLRDTAARIGGARLALYPRRGHLGAMMDPAFGRDVAAFLAGAT